MTKTCNNKEPQNQEQSPSTLKKPGRPRGYKVTEATRAKLKLSRNRRGRPAGATGNNVKRNLQKQPSSDIRIKTIWARYERYGWLVTGYSCNQCDDYYSHLQDDIDKHIVKCGGLTRSKQRNIKQDQTKQLVIRLTSGEVVIREELK